MLRISIFIFMVLPLSCLAQLTISGKVLNRDDKKPIDNASVFLSGASVVARSSTDGSFALRNARPGKYELVVSIVGFAVYRQNFILTENITLPDIELTPKLTALNEVKITFKNDPNRGRNYEWFQQEFLGTSQLAQDCKILNPQVLYLEYDEVTKVLTASTNEFLEIENKALGYRIKYLLTNFTMDNKDEKARGVHYEGSTLFENLPATPAQDKQRSKNKLQVYQGSLMHLLRAANANRLDEEGFKVLQYANYFNPQRPPDSLIDAKLKLFKVISQGNKAYRDSVAFWTKKSKLIKATQKLMQHPLQRTDLVTSTTDKGIYALTCGGDGLYVIYSKNRRFAKDENINYLYNRSNTTATFFTFTLPFAYFDSNGGIINPNSIVFTGAMGKNRVAELLPVDYEPEFETKTNLPGNEGETLLSSLKAYSETYVKEKAYLHLDKPRYSAGDTIYFKSYVTLGENHVPSTLSSVLYVDLINTANKVDQSLNIQLTDGMGWGDFALPDSLPKGNYSIRAYTNWMRNDADNAFFKQVIAISDNQGDKVQESATAMAPGETAKPDIGFFPEGGNLVTGIPSKIAFKAIGPGGLGTAVKGKLVDNDDREVAVFEPAHLGMGAFYFTPQPAKTYRARLVYADGTKSVVELPAAADAGVTLSVDNSAVSGAIVKLAANSAFYIANKSKVFTILVYSAATAIRINCRLDSQQVMLNISKAQLKTGIATITLFSPLNEPLAERLFFVQNNDQLGLVINSDKAIYNKWDKVTIGLKVSNPSSGTSEGHFSVSVTNDNLLPLDENVQSTIFNNLLFTSDLKGYVEDPNYYFLNATNKQNDDLDLVMLTHGFRRFEWKTLLGEGYSPIAYKAEKGLQINGIALAADGKPIVNSQISLMAKADGKLLTQITDTKGYFHFSNMLFADSTQFILQVPPGKKKNTTTLSYIKDEPLPVALATLVSANQPSSVGYQKLNAGQQAVEAAPKGAIMLKEVNIEIKSNTKPVKANLAAPGNASQVVGRRDLIKTGGSLSTRLAGKFHGPYSRQLIYNRWQGLLVMDGVQMPIDYELNNINPEDVEAVELLYGANAGIYGMQGAHGVLVITTRKGADLRFDNVKAIGVLPITVQGFHKARTFYSPKYEVAESAKKQPGYLTTTYWNPELVTDKDGNGTFTFNSGSKGSYRVVIEGIDESGAVGRQVYSYQVQ